MRCQHVDDDILCRLDATRRVSSGVATHRTPTSRDSRGPSTWSRSASSTTRPRRSMPLPRPPGSVRSANARGGSSTRTERQAPRTGTPRCPNLCGGTTRSWRHRLIGLERLREFDVAEPRRDELVEQLLVLLPQIRDLSR